MIKHKSSVLSVSSLIVLTLYSLILAAVFVWAIVFSVTDYWNDIYFADLYLTFPKKVFFENFSRAYESFTIQVQAGAGFRNVLMPEMFLNSILFALGTGLAGAIAPCLMGYIVSRFNFRFNKIIDTVVLVTIILPIVGALPSNIRIVYGLGLNDSIIGFWIMGFSFANMYYFVFKAAFLGVPKSISEAAYVDGASNLNIFLRINLPLVKTTFLSIFTLIFVSCWNNYTTPLAFAPNVPTAAYGMFRIIQNTQLAEPTAKMAAAMMLMLPILIFYAAANRFLMGNLTMGGVKE